MGRGCTLEHGRPAKGQMQEGCGPNPVIDAGNGEGGAGPAPSRGEI